MGAEAFEDARRQRCEMTGIRAAYTRGAHPVGRGEGLKGVCSRSSGTRDTPWPLIRTLS